MLFVPLKRQEGFVLNLSVSLAPDNSGRLAALSSTVVEFAELPVEEFPSSQKPQCFFHSVPSLQ